MAFTMVAIAVALVTCALLGVYFNNNLHNAAQQQINTKAYYLARSAGDIGVAALCYDNGTGNTLLEQVRNMTVSETYPIKDEVFIHHDAANVEIGSSQVKLTRQPEVVTDGPTYIWAVLDITTTIADTRNNTNTDEYVYQYRIKVRTDLPEVRLYSIQ